MKESYGTSQAKIETAIGGKVKLHDVKLTEIEQNELLVSSLGNLSKVTELRSVDLNRSFGEVVAELNAVDKNTCRIAWELFAIWVVYLLGLRISRWRGRRFHTAGKNKVDVIAASNKMTYDRWQILFEHTNNQVNVETLATQVGLAFLTHADVVMVVTTSGFTSDAVNYANQVTDTSRYYVILLDGDDIKQITADRARIIDILNAKARRVFARKEIGAIELRTNPVTPTGNNETQLGTEIAINAEFLFQAEEDDKA
jgi:hypothetical protein